MSAQTAAPPMNVQTAGQPVRYCGRMFAMEELDWIRQLVAAEPKLNRAQLSRRVCQELHWVRPDGGSKQMSCRVAMLRMQRDGLIALPPPQKGNGNGRNRPRLTVASDPQTPLSVSVRALGPLVFRPVDTPSDSALWNELIERYHYLGYKPLPGAQIRYLIFCRAFGDVSAQRVVSNRVPQDDSPTDDDRPEDDRRRAREGIPPSREDHRLACEECLLAHEDPLVARQSRAPASKDHPSAHEGRLFAQNGRPLASENRLLAHERCLLAQKRCPLAQEDHLLAALGFSAAAWKVAPRDEFIGWTADQRRDNLHRIVNNARFLILPWVTAHNLASRILAAAAKRLADDWSDRYGYTPVLLETFVDRDRFRGTCYRAANWIHAGQTQGRGKLDRHHHGLSTVKDIYLYPLHRRFRQTLRAPADHHH